MPVAASVKPLSKEHETTRLLIDEINRHVAALRSSAAASRILISESRAAIALSSSVVRLSSPEGMGPRWSRRPAK
jgi:hypothetical protein